MNSKPPVARLCCLRGGDGWNLSFALDFERAIDDIDQNLANGIDLAPIARQANCSAFHFQRVFFFAADILLSKYIRRRKLTLAAFELQNTEAKPSAESA